MELRHIRYFLAVAEHLNYSRAAEKLGVAQPALSKQIKDLEAELGGKLFHRTTTKVSLTEMGEHFRQQTQRVLMQLDIAVTGAQQIAAGTSGTLRIGCDWKTIGLPIPLAARLFGRKHPRIHIEFSELPVGEHIRAIRDNQIDISFVPSFFLGSTEDLDIRFLCSVGLDIILPNDHRLATREKLTMDDIRDERVLSLDADSVPGFRLIMAQILRFQPKYGLSTASMPSLMAHVTAGHGIGVMPDWKLDESSEGLTRVAMECAPLEFYAVSLKGASHPALGDYTDILEDLLSRRHLPR